MFYNIISAVLVTVLITVFYGQDSRVLSPDKMMCHKATFDSNIQASEVHNAAQVGDYIFEIFEDSKGNMWFGTRDNGVARYDGEELVYFTTEDGLCGKAVVNIAEDKEGKLWFGTHSNMCIYDPKGALEDEGQKFISFPSNGEVPKLGWGWKSVKTDRNGDIWVNSHHGIFQYNDNTFVEFDAPKLEKESFKFCNTPGDISMDLEDSKGNLWFGTDGDGVYKYDGSSYSHFTMEDGLPGNSVISILEDQKGNIWFTCVKSPDPMNGMGGVSMYDGNTFSVFKNTKGLFESSVHTIYEDKSGNIWVGATGTGVYRYDGKDFKLFKEPSQVVTVNSAYVPGLQSVLEDSKGRLWFGFAGGLFLLNGENFVNVTHEGPWGFGC